MAKVSTWPQHGPPTKNMALDFSCEAAGATRRKEQLASIPISTSQLDADPDLLGVSFLTSPPSFKDEARVAKGFMRSRDQIRSSTPSDTSTDLLRKYGLI